MIIKIYLYDLLSRDNELIITTTRNISNLEVMENYICVIFHDKKYSIYDKNFNFIEYVNKKFDLCDMYGSYIIIYQKGLVCVHDINNIIVPYLDIIQLDKWNTTFYKNYLICDKVIYKIVTPIMNINTKKYETQHSNLIHIDKYYRIFIVLIKYRKYLYYIDSIKLIYIKDSNYNEVN